MRYLLELPQHKHLLETDEEEIRITMRFSCDGAQVTKKKSAVRGVVQLVGDRENITMPTPQDEVTLYEFEGVETAENHKKYGAQAFHDMQQAHETGIVVGEKTVYVTWYVPMVDMILI